MRERGVAMREMHKLRELLLGALSLGGGRSVSWEQNIVDACDMFFGGTDVFFSGPDRLGCGYLLSTIIDRSQIMFSVYEHVDSTCTVVDDGVRRHVIIGRGLFARCVIGDLFEVRNEIESSYNQAIRLLGEDEFLKTIGKSIPYVASTDERLVDFSEGVIDYKTNTGMGDAPLILTVGTTRLCSREYHDVRQYGDLEDLMNGMFGIWSTLVTPDEDDWELFSRIVRSAFQ